MVGSGIYLYKRNIPTSLKVIHARMVAQGGVIAGLCGVGLYSLVTEASAPRCVTCVCGVCICIVRACFVRGC